MPTRTLPYLSPSQVVQLQDALLANADRLLTSALAVLELGNVALARSLAILGMEESAKAIALHERRVRMAYASEGEAFVDARLQSVWANHEEKLELVYHFLTDELYWFDVEPSDPVKNSEYLGAIKGWIRRHNKLKQRGFYVDVDRTGGVLEPTDVSEERSLTDVISHVYQIGWQLRLGEHIEAQKQSDAELGVPPASEEDVEFMLAMLSAAEADDLTAGDDGLIAGLVDPMRAGTPGTVLNNGPYRLRLSGAPFVNLGKPGYEAETRELRRLAGDLDRGANE